MADNDRFVIQKIQTNKKCFFREQDGIESHPRTRCLIDPQSYYYVFDSDCKKCEEGRTRAEYEDIILQIAKTAVTAETLAKDICDRLFGEGE